MGVAGWGGGGWGRSTVVGGARHCTSLAARQPAPVQDSCCRRPRSSGRRGQLVPSHRLTWPALVHGAWYSESVCWYKCPSAGRRRLGEWRQQLRGLLKVRVSSKARCAVYTWPGGGPCGAGPRCGAGPLGVACRQRKACASTSPGLRTPGASLPASAGPPCLLRLVRGAWSPRVHWIQDHLMW